LGVIVALFEVGEECAGFHVAWLEDCCEEDYEQCCEEHRECSVK
jgi:hypothetical protein